MNARKRVTLTLVILALALFATSSLSYAAWWSKKGKGDRAYVEMPQADKDASRAMATKDDASVGGKKKSGAAPADSKSSAESAAKVAPRPPTPKVNPPAPQPVVPPKTELEKRQDELAEAQKEFDRKKYSKSLEKSSKLISELRKRGLDTKGTDGKGKDAQQFSELMDQALALAEKSGGLVDKPSIPSSKVLYFVF
ncbi:MAG: hypothetical protein ACOX0A_07920 [Thermoguttaceae bacterium]|jgi:type IV secretory pathway VirB10-like protein